MSASFDPCREWLGIDSSDLVSPHLVLGVAATESDMLTIVRAADQRLARLRGFDPGSLAQVRDALVARVEQSRDTMLSGVAAVHSLGRGIAAAAAPPPADVSPQGVAPRPPVPPPVPGAASASAMTPVAPAPSPWATPPAPTGFAAPPPPSQPFDQASALAPVEPVAVRVRRGPTYRRSSGTGGTLVVLALLVAVAAGLAAYVMKQPTLMRRLLGAKKDVAALTDPDSPDRKPNSAYGDADTTQPKTSNGASPPAHDPSAPPNQDPPAPVAGGLDTLPGRKKPIAPMVNREGAAAPDTDPDMRSNKPAPADDAATPGPNEGDAPKPDAPEPQPTAQVDEKALNDRLRAAYAALCRQEFDVAEADIKKAAGIAADDPDAVHRVNLWERFATYAREFKVQLDKALDAKADGGEVPDGDRTIAIVEVSEKTFKYRDGGVTERIPRNGIPENIVMAIITQWFEADGRAANYLFIGTRHLAKRKSDPDAARAAWQRAADGGEAEGRALQALLEDPAIRAAAE